MIHPRLAQLREKIRHWVLGPKAYSEARKMAMKPMPEGYRQELYFNPEIPHILLVIYRKGDSVLSPETGQVTTIPRGFALQADPLFFPPGSDNVSQNTELKHTGGNA